MNEEYPDLDEGLVPSEDEQTATCTHGKSENCPDCPN